MMLALLFAIVPTAANAADTVDLNALPNATAGSEVTISGISTFSEVGIKVVHPNKTIIFLDQIAVSGGSFSVTFCLPSDLPTGTYMVGAGQGDTAATTTLSVTALPPTQLDKPGKPTLTNKVATWSAVAHENNGYSLQLYKDGNTFGSVVTVVHGAALTYDFSSTMTEVGSYTVTVTAKGAGLYADSESSEVSDPEVINQQVIVVAGVSLNKTKTTISKGSSESLIAVVAPSTATNQNVIWSSNNTNVAMVNNVGKVTGVWAGTATITVTTVDGNKTASCLVTVTANTGGGVGGGGGIPTSSTVNSTTGSAYITPSQGGTVSLGGQASITIPAGALKGSSSINVEITRYADPPGVPSGFMVNGNAYRVTVNGQEHYQFNQPVTLTFSFDPAQVSPGSVPCVYYYDASTSKWVSLGGTVSGNTITVTIDHFTIFAVMVKKSADNAGGLKKSFNDTENHWAKDAIEKLAGLGAVSGYPDGSFKPDAPITRAEFVTMLVKALDLTAKGDVPAFKDSAGHWASAGISIVAALGLVSGYSDGCFKPDSLITREEIAVIAFKAAKLNQANGEISFNDNVQISSWAQGSVLAAVNANIIKGYPDNTFRPQGHATRAEAVSVIINIMK